MLGKVEISRALSGSQHLYWEDTQFLTIKTGEDDICYYSRDFFAVDSN